MLLSVVETILKIVLLEVSTSEYAKSPQNKIWFCGDFVFYVVSTTFRTDVP